MSSVVYIVNIALIGFLSFLLWRRASHTLRKFFWPALLIKLMAGIALGVVYTYYYQANDTFQFFNDAKLLTAAARTDVHQYLSFLWSGREDSPLWGHVLYVEPRTVFFIKGLSLVLIITNDNYWIASLWFSFLSFLGCWYVFVRLNNFFSKVEWPAALSLFFFPSFIFWSSGIIKESVAIAAVCFMAGIFLLLMNRRTPSWIEGVVFLFSIYALWSLKYYWAAVLIPTMSTSLFVKYIIERKSLLKSKAMEAGIWLLAFITLCFGVSFIHPNFYLDRLLAVIADNHNQFIAISAAEGVIHFSDLNATWYSMFINAPWALFSGLFRPSVLELHSPLQIIAAVENSVLLVLFVFSVSRIRFVFQSSHRLILYSAIVYITLLCVFLALSTPNFGTLSRYRIGFLPVFCLLILYENPLWNKLIPRRK